LGFKKLKEICLQELSFILDPDPDSDADPNQDLIKCCIQIRIQIEVNPDPQHCRIKSDPGPKQCFQLYKMIVVPRYAA
jgi:hypothetical protein